jgi:carbamoyl-phosphate synthase large subunit
LKRPTWDRIFKIKEAMQAGVSIKTIHEITLIDKWFLYQIQDIITTENTISQQKHLEAISEDLMWKAKEMGFSDEQIADC